MAAWLDNLTAETPRELSDSSVLECLLKRWTFGMISSNTLPLVDKKEVDDPCWFKIRKEAEQGFKTGNLYGFSYDFLFPLGGDFLIYDKLLKYDSLESALADWLACKLTKFRYYRLLYCVNEKEKEMLREVILSTFTENPEIRRTIREDLRAATECNPNGKKNYLLCFLNSKGFLACQAYRVANKLWSLGDKSMALKIQDMASKAFQVDIHPGAKIGSGILIDEHATGVVIGKRAVIGDNVTILKKNLYSCRGNSLSGKINYDSLSALTDEVFVFIPYDMSKFVTCSKKSFHGIAVAGGFHHKFNNLSPGKAYARESYEDGGGQFHTIQVHDGDHDSPQSIQLASPALKNTSFASDQNDKRPPPDRFPSHIKIGAEIVQEESEFNQSGLAKIFLLLSANLCLAASAVGLVAGKFLPETARILLSSAGLCSLAGFVLCSVGYVLQSSRRAKPGVRLMTAGGVVAATFAFVLIMGSLVIVMNPFRILDFNFSV